MPRTNMGFLPSVLIGVHFTVPLTRKFFNDILGFFGFKIVSEAFFNSAHQELARFMRIQEKIHFVSRNTSDVRTKNLFNAIIKSQSQLFQDLFVLETLDYKQNGVFVEFGAGDGVHLSNTFLLEKEFNWSGVLAEPARRFHEELRKSRDKALICEKIVWPQSGDLVNFFENEIGELSGTHNSESSKSADTYTCETITLLDLLIEYSMPRYIDFLSIDTEGSEYSILEDFDFDMFAFGVICIEHNFSENREKINELLLSKGYKRVLRNESRFDDWYVSLDRTSGAD